MCGIFGFVSKEGERPNLKLLAKIATVTEERGPHAFGFSWIDGSGRLRSFKQAGRITRSLELLAMATDARMLIGHTRYATQGDPAHNVNNHPHPCDGGWLVHNGMVRNYAELVDSWSMHPTSSCDSEALAQLVEQLPGTLVERCRHAAQLCEGPLALAAIWRGPQRLIALRNGNPLALGENDSAWYFASSERALPGGKRLADGRILSWSRRGRVATLTKSMLEPEQQLPLLTPQPAAQPETKRPAVRETRPRYEVKWSV